MTRVNLKDTDFYGRVSAAPWGVPSHKADCTRCGSSLAGRRVAVRRETSRGIAFVIEEFRCGCGRGGRVKREVAAR